MRGWILYGLKTLVPRVLYVHSGDFMNPYKIVIKVCELVCKY